MTTEPSRRHTETHPWLTFEFDLGRLSYDIWLLLGEAESKCQHLAWTPLAPDVAARLHQIYLSKGVHGTTAIEGNTLSEDAVHGRVAGSLALPASQEYLGREIDNIVAACNEIVARTLSGQAEGISAARIKEYNRAILDGLPRKPEVEPGALREHSVTVGLSSYRGAPAEDLGFLLGRLADWLNGMSAPEGRPELRFPIGVLKAVLAHLYLAWIHPFGDGNGRTARLVEFQLMVEAGAPVPAAHLFSDHYNKTRGVYLIELDRTSAASGFPVNGFIRYALEGFVDGLREQIDLVQAQQMAVAWINYIHDQFHDQDTPAPRRQRHLMLDFPVGQVVPRAKIPEISTRMARHYARAGERTLTRDLNALVAKGLLAKVGRGYRARQEIMFAFLPATRSGQAGQQ